MTTAVGSTWAGSYDFGAERLARPRSLSELQEVVGGARRVRALGSRHSFTDLADSPGVLVALDRLPAEISVDSGRGEATAAAGMTLGALAAALHDQGMAFATMASLPHISVAGAVATGTHGSGEGIGSLAALVRRLELVGPGGELRTVSRGEQDFEGWVVALGALGVVHRVTLDVVPTFEVHQHVYTGLAWETLLDGFEQTMTGGYSVSAFTDWVSTTVNQLWVKTASGRPPVDAPIATRSAETLHMIPGGQVEALTDQLGVAGPWHERLPHFKASFTPSSGVELQTEYFVPRSAARDALQELRALGPLVAPLLQVSEIRTISGDDLWLSGAQGGDVVGLHFTWHRDWAGVHAVLPRIEEALRPLRARPHWGKCFTTAPAELDRVFPRLDDFRRLRARVDPDETFGNRFLDRVLGPRGAGSGSFS